VTKSGLLQQLLLHSKRIVTGSFIPPEGVSVTSKECPIVRVVDPRYTSPTRSNVADPGSAGSTGSHAGYPAFPGDRE